jgi:hypothetical protein
MQARKVPFGDLTLYWVAEECRHRQRLGRYVVRNGSTMGTVYNGGRWVRYGGGDLVLHGGRGGEEILPAPY